jgi:hypothetical protein
LPPGGDFYSNDTMLAYLLSLPIGLRPTVAKFLVQPKDDGDPRTGGFSLASLNATTDALLALARAHQCTAIVGLDFGGDVVLPDPRRASGVSSGPFIKRRDSLNCHAVGEAARKLGVPATLVVSAPGVDAAAVAPEYARRLGGPGGATVPVFAMGADEANPCSLAPVPGPAPPCSLPELPEALTRARMPAPVEAAFVHELRRLAERIAYDALGRVIARVDGDGAAGTRLRWTGPHLAGIADPVRRVAWTRDPQGRVLLEAVVIGSTAGSGVGIAPLRGPPAAAEGPAPVMVSTKTTPPTMSTTRSHQGGSD